ncbi:DUF1015 domain-containing protein [Gillisia limnaea]|uniref:Uncharacterized conserved protein UCP033563 n=1 Tax=Gillisia limnaea (strain DSM 15749 / LMG 21470 / R-8282) TaxID=865937 RepID=H2BT93_GILLR|nr:DUF1015 domain-containing protein [Gillisia limnaea]EHQ03692.1 Uncharacterized conserved protein UCP033563 [Gillisia limnaea DSM 15749]
MAKINPFKAVRPTKDKAGLVASRPYEDYTEGELKAQLQYNPFSFLHIINPGYKFQHEITGEKRFQLVKNRYLEFKEEEIFIKDPAPCYYFYKIVTRNDSFFGIIAAASLEDYENNIIKKHEDTIAFRENLFKDYLKVVGFNTEPVLLTYPDSAVIDELIEEAMNTRPEYEFTTHNKETHFLWTICEPKIVEQIKREFEKMPALYIADGHHRCSSSYILSKESKAENPMHSGEEPYNYFMSFLIAESKLKIYEFSRLVTDLNGWSKEEFLMQLDEQFRIENRGSQLYSPKSKNHFNMYLDGEFYSLFLRKTNYEFTDSLSTLDTYILYEKLLKPILGIQDLRNDLRISYIHGKNDLIEMKSEIDSGRFTVGFGMLPLTIEEIKKVADEGLIMPPKSTYIEPKLRSGLTIYEF